MGPASLAASLYDDFGTATGTAYVADRFGERHLMSTQVQLRRDNAANVAAFTGKPGEVIVDTTNNRLCLQDGATAGGIPAAKLSEVVTLGATSCWRRRRMAAPSASVASSSW